MIPIEILLAKFNAGVVVQQGCWGWKSSAHKRGYGRLRYGKEEMLVHRFSYEFFVGKIQDGMEVCHRCDNPPCTNPKHLFLGTQKDNLTDMRSKGRGVVPVSPMLRGSESARAKLSESLVSEILTSQETNKFWAKKLDVDPSLISRVRSRKRWRHV